MEKSSPLTASKRAAQALKMAKKACAWSVLGSVSSDLCWDS
jgi:hypothetical protein